MRVVRSMFVVACALSAAVSQAVVAFDNFGPGTTFNTSIGMTIAGSTASVNQSRQAVKFNSAATGSLDYIEFAAGLVSGTDRLIVTLLSDSSGSLGPWITSWYTSGYPAFGGSYSPKMVVNGFPNIVLTAGTDYWLMLEPDENTIWGPGSATDTWAAWNWSPTGVGDVAYSSDGGATYTYDTGSQGAYRVVLADSAVPGPAAALPFAIGLLAARRRRK